MIAQSLYAIATATSIVFPTWVSITLIFLIQLNYVIAPRIPILHRFLGQAAVWAEPGVAFSRAVTSAAGTGREK